MPAKWFHEHSIRGHIAVHAHCDKHREIFFYRQAHGRCHNDKTCVDYDIIDVVYSACSGDDTADWLYNIRLQAW